ncbi:MAG: hypothetical protein U0835_01290 [Isosphaeraceae bacterium]
MIGWQGSPEDLQRLVAEAPGLAGFALGQPQFCKVRQTDRVDRVVRPVDVLADSLALEQRGGRLGEVPRFHERQAELFEPRGVFVAAFAIAPTRELDEPAARGNRLLQPLLAELCGELAAEAVVLFLQGGQVGRLKTGGAGVPIRTGARLGRGGTRAHRRESAGNRRVA